MSDGDREGTNVVGLADGPGEGIMDGTKGERVGLGDGIKDGPKVGSEVVGKLEGLGVGSEEGINDGEGEGKSEGPELGTGVGAPVAGQMIQIKFINFSFLPLPFGSYTSQTSSASGGVTLHSPVESE